MSAWRDELQRTPDCISIDRFAEQLTPVEQEHIATCARCEAEFELWRQVTDANSAADEGAAVRWIAAETLRRRKATTAPRKSTSFGFDWIRALRPQTLAVAATVLIGAAVVLVTYERGSRSIENIPQGPTTYRSGGVRLIGPFGDLPAAPVDLEWEPVSGAASYDVDIREVDETLVWHGATGATHVTLPQEIRSQIVPARTLSWRVTARTGGGATLAESETGRFRVAPNGSPRKQP